LRKIPARLAHAVAHDTLCSRLRLFTSIADVRAGADRAGIALFGPAPRDILLRHAETRSYAGGLVQSEYEIDAEGEEPPQRLSAALPQTASKKVAVLNARP
jgi:hypothetical protein